MRYADDLTFSTNREKVLFDIPTTIRELLHTEFGNKIVLNHAKTAFSSKAHNRHVTGITITNDDRLSLGRGRKRYVKHLIHQFIGGVLDEENIAHLKGLLAFAQHIEPGFLQALRKKYGSSVLVQISKA